MLDAGKDALQFALGRERTHLLSKKNHQGQTDNDDDGSEHQEIPITPRSCFGNLVLPLLNRRFDACDQLLFFQGRRMVHFPRKVPPTLLDDLPIDAQ